jgi:polyisoprenoid-binding protein YceI
LRGQILKSAQPEYEFAIFTPKRLDGLPLQVTIGQPFSFHIVGDLTVRGTTRETTFDATVTATSHSTIAGSATAEIRYTDFGLGIPEAPGVAGVAERVRLEIDFSAIAVAAS